MLVRHLPLDRRTGPYRLLAPTASAPDIRIEAMRAARATAAGQSSGADLCDHRSIRAAPTAWSG